MPIERTESTDERVQPDKPQTEAKHPNVEQEALNPNHMAGQNVGNRPDRVRASDVKELTRFLQGFDNAELDEIFIVTEGARLQQDATYLNIRDGQTFTATGEDTAGRNSWLVPKAEVPHQYWNRLVGVSEPERRQ